MLKAFDLPLGPHRHERRLVQLKTRWAGYTVSTWNPGSAGRRYDCYSAAGGRIRQPYGWLGLVRDLYWLMNGGSTNKLNVKV
jgi:hypothetical protein